MATINNALMRNISVTTVNDNFAKQMSLYYTDKKEKELENQIENPLIQPNKITKALYSCSANSQKILCFAIKQFMLTKNQSADRWVSLDLTSDEYCISKFNGKKSRDILKQAISEVVSLQMQIEDKKSFIVLNVFEAGKFSKSESDKVDWKNIRFKFTEEFTKMICENSTKGNFTTLNLNVIKNMNSFYAIRFYEIAMLYRGFKGKILPQYFESDWAKENISDKQNTWCFGYSLEALRTLFCIEVNSYERTSNFISIVVNNPIKILNEQMPNLTIKVEVKRYGRNQIEGIVFWVTEKTYATLPYPIDDTPKKIIKNSKLISVSVWQQYLMKYDAVADAFLDAVKSTNDYKDLSLEDQQIAAIQLMNKNNFFI